MAETLAQRATALHRQALVWDMLFPGLPFDDAGRERMLGRLVESGYKFVSLTVAGENDSASTLRSLAHEWSFFGAREDRYLVVDTADDVTRAQREGKLAVGFHFQGTGPLERSLELLSAYHRLGVRGMLMAYNEKNSVGDGCHERTDGGLSRFGVRVVEEMNRLGMLVDCTHTGYRTTMDVFEVSKAPVIFSHSNARAVCDHERNIRDDQARACARSGGVIGVNGVGIFLGDNDSSTERILRHIDYYVGLVGAEHVGLGLDYVEDVATLMRVVIADPVRFPTSVYPSETPYTFAGPEQMPEITEGLLARGYSDADVRGILGENWLRVVRAVWK
jgi:membrane dipeptidase